MGPGQTPGRTAQPEAQARPQLDVQPGSSPIPPPPLHCEFEPPGRFQGSPAKRGDKQGDSGSAQLALRRASIPQAAMKQDSLCLLNKGACGSFRWPEKKPPHHPPGALRKHSRCSLHHTHLGSRGTYVPRSTSSGHASQSPWHSRRCTRVDTSRQASPRVQLISVVFPGWASPDLSPANADPTRS